MRLRRLNEVVEKEFDNLLNNIGFSFTKEYLQSRVYNKISLEKKYRKKVNKIIDANLESYQRLTKLKFIPEKNSYVVRKFSICNMDWEDLDRFNALSRESFGIHKRKIVGDPNFLTHSDQ